MKQTPTMFAMLGLLGTLGTLAGCGDDRLKVQGSVTLTVHQNGLPDGNTGFEFPSGTVIDSPPGVGAGVFGRCVREGRTWIVEIDRAMPAGDGLQRFSIRVPDTETLESPQATFVLAPSTFRGSTNCRVTATRTGESLVVTANCTGLVATMEPRIVDAAMSLTLNNCANGE